MHTEGEVSPALPGGDAPSARPFLHPNLQAAMGAISGASGDVWGAIGRGSPAGARALGTFTILPSARDPRLLLPSSRRPAARALHQYTNATSATQRMRAELMSLAIRLGAGDRLLKDRLHLLTTESGSASSQLPLSEFLREVFGHRDLEVAVRLGPMRPNRKPVLQILSRHGDVLGYAKISRNALTARLVRHEAQVLQRFGEMQPGPTAFNVPRLIHSGPWAGMETLVVGPLPQRRLRLRPDLELPAAATRELAGIFGTRQEVLAHSAYWAQTKERVAAMGSTADTVAGPIGSLEDRYGGQELGFGSWHGDWTPHNMGSVRGRLYVWDWERCSTSVPIGLDLMHFGFHIARKFRGKGPAEAASSTLDWSAPLLREVGLRTAPPTLLLALALLEMAVRFEEARTEGVEVTDPAYLSALQGLIASGS